MEPAPSAGRRRSRAAGLRCGGPGLHSSSGAGPPSTRPRACLAAGEGARARVSRPLPAPLPPGRLRDRAGSQSRERAEQRAAASAPLPARRRRGARRASPPRRPCLASPLPPRSPAALRPARSLLSVLGNRLASPLARLLPPGPCSLRPLLCLLPPDAQKGPSPPHRGGHKPIRGRAGRRAAGVAEFYAHAHAAPPPGLWRRFPRSSPLFARWGGSAEGCLCGSGLPS